LNCYDTSYCIAALHDGKKRFGAMVVEKAVDSHAASSDSDRSSKPATGERHYITDNNQPTANSRQQAIALEVVQNS